MGSRKKEKGKKGRDVRKKSRGELARVPFVFRGVQPFDRKRRADSRLVTLHPIVLTRWEASEEARN